MAPIWVVTNGVEAQRNIVDTVPGRRDYSPLWAVRTVTWTTGATPRVLRSKAAVLAAQRAGEVAVRAMLDRRQLPCALTSDGSRRPASPR